MQDKSNKEIWLSLKLGSMDWNKKGKVNVKIDFFEQLQLTMSRDISNIKVISNILHKSLDDIINKICLKQSLDKQKIN